MKKRQRPSNPNWLLIPPIPTFIIALYLTFFSRSSQRIELNLSLWIFIILLYLAVSVTYVMCINRNIKKSIVPLQMIAQGLALLVLPIVMGAPYGFSWIGIAFMTVGIISTINLLVTWLKNRPTVKLDKPDIISVDEKEMSSMFIKNIPFPSLVFDDQENLLNYNKEMESLLGIGGEELFSQKLSLIFPPDIKEIEINDEKWSISRKNYSKNANLLCLIENSKEPGTNVPADAGIIDPETGLLSKKISDIVVTTELKRSFRYRRWLSIILLKIVDGDNSDPAYECPEHIAIEYGNFLRINVRECDMAFYIEKGTYLFLLPETPGVGAKNTLKKLENPPDELKTAMLNEIKNCKVLSSIMYCSGNKQLKPGDVIKELKENLGKEEIIVY